jgi:hypothetical protein
MQGPEREKLHTEEAALTMILEAPRHGMLSPFAGPPTVLEMEGDKPKTRKNPKFAPRLKIAVDAYTAIAGNTREGLCEKVGCSLRTLLSWLKGTTEPDASEITDLVMHCSVSTDWLFGFTDLPEIDETGISRAMLVDMDLEDAVLGDSPDRKTVSAFIEWCPRLFVGLGEIPPRRKVVTGAEGDRIRTRVDAAIKRRFPDLWEKWHELHQEALERTGNEPRE